MRFIFNFLVAMPALLLLASCASSPKISYFPGNAEIKENTKFYISKITNSSTYQAKPDEEGYIDIILKMQVALKNALSNKNALASSEDDCDYKIGLNIYRYEPGNAAARVFVSGAAATSLITTTHIIERDCIFSDNFSGNKDDMIASILASQSIMGGGFSPIVSIISGAMTSGAWEYIFDEVAMEIAKTLTDRNFRDKRAKKK